MINPKVKEILISGDTISYQITGIGVGAVGYTGQMRNIDQAVWLFETLLKQLQNQLQAQGETLFINQGQDMVKEIVEP